MNINFNLIFLKYFRCLCIRENEHKFYFMEKISTNIKTKKFNRLFIFPNVCIRDLFLFLLYLFSWKNINDKKYITIIFYRNILVFNAQILGSYNTTKTPFSRFSNEHFRSRFKLGAFFKLYKYQDICENAKNSIFT